MLFFLDVAELYRLFLMDASSAAFPIYLSHFNYSTSGLDESFLQKVLYNSALLCRIVQ